MHFRTVIPISQSEFKIDHNSKIMSLGSCFAVNIGKKFDFFKFQSVTNPFGILFNSVSIEKIIGKALHLELYSEDDIFFYNERWHCFDVHSDLSNSNKEEFLIILNQLLQATRQQLLDSSHLIITYGSSWVYRKKDTNSIVANCHKLPQKEFIKEILSVKKNANSISKTVGLVQKANPQAKVILTVSPVRHLKDGFVENQQSKSHLISAIHKVIHNQLLGISYFPSYEIMMDELRDYRFYAEDMLHPNQVAIDYIWKQFSQTNISIESQILMNEILAIQKGLAHKSFNENSNNHRLFLNKLHSKIAILNNQYPQIKF